jgi:hypothetical protein
MAQKKVTYRLDDQTVHGIEDAAARLNKPKSAVVRGAIADDRERIGRLSDNERHRLLKVLAQMGPSTGSTRAVDSELKHIRAARSDGGRGGTRRGSR